MTTIKTNFGAGGANLTPGGQGKPTLATTLRDVADDLANQGADAQVLGEETVVVSTNVGLLRYEAESIEYVEATAGSVTGPMSRVGPSATLATTQYKLSADRRTLTFFATDAVTSASVGYKKRATQPAELLADTAQTYVLADAQTLLVKIDDGSAQTVTFETADFSNIALATAAEVAAVIDTDLTDAGGLAIGTKPLIRSDTRGAGSSVEVTGGTANAVLGFSTTKVVADQLKTVKG